MAEEALLERLDRLHEEHKNKTILAEINALPEEIRREYGIQGRLARALGNLGQMKKALEVLESTREEGENDPLWWYRTARALLGFDRFQEAKRCFVRTLELDPTDRDARYFIPLCDTMANKGESQAGKGNKY